MQACCLLSPDREACRHTVAALAVKKCSLLILLPEILGHNKCNNLSP